MSSSPAAPEPEDLARASIAALGFLSPEIQRSVPQIRAQNPLHFQLADDMSRFGQKLMYYGVSLAASSAIVSQRGTGTLLLIRSASNFQGAIILAERGMTIEAQTLVRSCYENSVLIGGLTAFPEETIEHMRADERDSQIGRLSILADAMERNGDPAPAIEHLRGRIAAISATPKPKKLSTAKVAELVDILPHYLFFRQISASSAHPSLGALDKHLEFIDGDSVGFGIGQDFDGVQNTLEIGCHAFVSCLAFYTRLISDDSWAQGADELHLRLMDLAIPEQVVATATKT